MKTVAVAQIAVGLLAVVLCAMALGHALTEKHSEDAAWMGGLLVCNLCLVGYGVRGFRDAE
jgi:uncharacterized membrane protein YhhN